MKKAILSPLCSAFVIQGLGQIINQRSNFKTPPLAQSLRQAQILILEIFNIFLWLKFSPSLTLDKIEHFETASQHIKKGVCILFTVFVLLAGGTIALSLMIQAVLKQVEINPSKPGVIIDGFRAQDSSALWYLLAAFAVLWLYSVLDAYLAGRKIDQLGKGDFI